jgi:limonene-1,2-epoxide hydrolase
MIGWILEKIKIRIDGYLILLYIYQVDPNKVVIWRSFFNAESPRLWKRRVEKEYWDELITFFEVYGL